MSVNFFTSSHQRRHLLTAEGFLKDQIVLILFKVSIKQIPNFSVIVLFPFFFLNCWKNFGISLLNFISL